MPGDGPGARGGGLPGPIPSRAGARRTRSAYAALTAAVLAVEVGIALFLRDALVRPFVGDALVVVLIFGGLRVLRPHASGVRLALGVLLFACAVEVSQALDLVALLGLSENRLVSTVLGRTFSGPDFAAYLAGFLACLGLDRTLGPRSPA